MRQRITFFQQPEDSIDPKTIKVTTNSISTTGLKAAREDRITFGFEELPQELYRVLKGAHELHIKWVSEEPYESIVPLVSRVSPGLHVFYTPQRNSNNSNLLCPALNKVFGDVDCTSPETTFTTLPIERFSHSSASQHYTILPTLSPFITYLTHKLCAPSADPTCAPRASLLSTASSLDIDFDTISHALTLTAFWPSRLWSPSLTTTPSNRLELGILSIQPPQEPEELSLGGFLTILGQDTHPTPTLFSFPARHHPFPSTFSTSFLQPTGLHPTLHLSIPSSTPPRDDESCALHAHLTLPKAVFADKYQLSDSLFLKSNNLSTLHYITTPLDLEAPSYTVPAWGSTLLLSLNPPSPSSPESFNATIPLHLRYLPPHANGSQTISIPAPVVFWACTADEGSKFTVNPFERVNLGYEGLFGPRTMFYHLSPEATGKLVSEVQVPVLDSEKARYVEVGTAVVVGLGFMWVVWCLMGVWGREGYGRKKKVG